MRLCAAWLVLCGTALGAENVRLVYLREAGAEGCPDEARVKSAVSARLGYDPFVYSPAASRLEGRGTRTVRIVLALQGRWLRAAIQLTDENGELLGTNQLTPRVRDCETLASAVELAIALAIDPLAASGAGPLRAPEPSPSPEPVVVEPRVIPPHPLVIRRARSERKYDDEDLGEGVHLAGHVIVLGAVGSAPQATWGVALGLGAQWRRYSVGLELRGDIPGSRVSSGGTVSSSLVIVSFLPCVRAYGFSFCGLLSTGVLIAFGADYAVDRTVVLPFAGGGARAAFEFRLTKRLAMGFHADLLAPFTRALLRVDDQEVFHADPVSGAFGVLVSGLLK